MGRQERDGNKNEVKSDKFRNSDFEVEDWGVQRPRHFSGVSRQGANTLGGKTAENRGHRSAGDLERSAENPFENGQLENWNHRQGWDHFYNRRLLRSDRTQFQGGALIGTGRGEHTGRGPRGYTRSDDRVREDVCETLTLAAVDVEDVEVRVEKGIVYLTGTVADRRSKVRIEEMLDGISGVKDVQNLITLKEGRTGRPPRPGEDHEGTKH